MITVENEISSPGAAIRVSTSIQNAGLVTVKVYARHKRTCPRCNRPDWARCNCVKWLYIYRDGKDKSTSAKTRNWERAEQKAREIRDSFDPIRQLQRQLELRAYGRNLQMELAPAVEEFIKKIPRLSRGEATRDKYQLTLDRLFELVQRSDTAHFPPLGTRCSKSAALDSRLDRYSHQPPQPAPASHRIFQFLH